MYKVILVDDDELVRVGLESLVSFSKKGFQIIDVCSGWQLQFCAPVLDLERIFHSWNRL